jgi:hypothetical protein
MTLAGNRSITSNKVSSHALATTATQRQTASIKKLEIKFIQKIYRKI